MERARQRLGGITGIGAGGQGDLAIGKFHADLRIAVRQQGNAANGLLQRRYLNGGNIRVRLGKQGLDVWEIRIQHARSGFSVIRVQAK